jgi:CRISPR-associated protein Cas2
MYQEILVTYDISDTKNRNKFFEYLKDVGLVSIQKSVFWGFILPSEKKTIELLIKNHCDIATDKAIVINVTLGKNIENMFGYTKGDFIHPQGFDII